MGHPTLGRAGRRIDSNSDEVNMSSAQKMLAIVCVGVVLIVVAVALRDGKLSTASNNVSAAVVYCYDSGTPIFDQARCLVPTVEVK